MASKTRIFQVAAFTLVLLILMLPIHAQASPENEIPDAAYPDNFLGIQTSPTGLSNLSNLDFDKPGTLAAFGVLVLIVLGLFALVLTKPK